MKLSNVRIDIDNDMIIEIIKKRIAELNDEIHCPTTAKCQSCKSKRKTLHNLIGQLGQLIMDNELESEADNEQ